MNFFDKLKETLGKLNGRQRFQLGMAMVGTMAMVWGLSYYAGQIRYGVLFSGLEQADASSVLAALQERQVSYRLSAGGRTIEVPIERVDELRLEMAGEGLPPGGGVGFEIFDKPAFGLSDFVQNVNYRRALERELSRTIQSLGAVESARVHLALPPESVFAGEKKEPTASVVVRLKGANTLPRDRVQAITHLVASGVQGLDPSRVKIIAGDGRMLSEAGNADEAMLSASQLEARRKMEQGIESTLVSLLEPIVGPDGTRARATVELNLKRVHRREESYDPNVAVIRSERKSKSEAGGSAAGGSPGTASNLPGGAGGASSAGSSKNKSQDTETNFELNKTVSEIAEPVGTLARQSVAVVVDHLKVETTGDDGETTLTATPRSAEEMQKISDLIRAAIGIDETRGDVLIVENFPFDDKATHLVDEGGDGIGLDFWLKMVRFASLPLAVLLMALLVIRPGISALRTLQGPKNESAALPPTVAALQAQLQGQMTNGALPEMFSAPSPMRRKLIEAAGEDPKAAALVLRGWLGDAQDRD